MAGVALGSMTRIERDSSRDPRVSGHGPNQGLIQGLCKQTCNLMRCRMLTGFAGLLWALDRIFQEG